MFKLTTSSTVAQWVAEHPQTARVFEELQIDYCCGGGIALGDACAKKRLNADSVVAQLTEVVASPQLTDNWLDSSLTELCDHIEQTHHAYLREELVRLTGLIDRVVAAHGSNHPELGQLKQVFAALRDELEPHMLKEEQILFPAIREIETAGSRPHFPFGTVAAPIRMMEHEHDIAGSALAQIRKLTNGFEPPKGSCNTYRVMLDSLRRLEEDLHQHIHKENFILFPRAQKLEGSLNASQV